MQPDVFDADLSVAREAVDCLGVWLAVWSYRREPDAHARRCASDAIAAADDLLAATHRIRARLAGQVREADDQADARADELLAKMRDGPGAVTPGPSTPNPEPARGAEVMRSKGTPGRRHGGEPREGGAVNAYRPGRPGGAGFYRITVPDAGRRYLADTRAP